MTVKSPESKSLRVRGRGEDLSGDARPRESLAGSYRRTIGCDAVRGRSAVHYLGLDRRVFNERVRPALTLVLIGRPSVAFDRLELDRWIESHLGRGGRSTSSDAGEAMPKGVSENLARRRQDRQRRTRRYRRELKRRSLARNSDNLGHDDLSLSNFPMRELVRSARDFTIAGKA